jgi:hypothetical protein
VHQSSDKPSSWKRAAGNELQDVCTIVNPVADNSHDMVERAVGVVESPIRKGSKELRI